MLTSAWRTASPTAAVSVGLSRSDPLVGDQALRARSFTCSVLWSYRADNAA